MPSSIDFGHSIEVCGSKEGKHFIAGLSKGGVEKRNSRMVLLELKDHIMVNLAVLDQNIHGFNTINVLQFWRIVGKQILWIGLSGNRGHLFCFETELVELMELAEKGFKLKEVLPLKIHRPDGDEDNFYYSGILGRIISLNISI